MAGPYICLYFSYLFLFRKVKIKRVVAQLNSNFSVVKNSVTDVQNKITNHDISSGTILDWFIAHKKDASDTFVASTYYPPDKPEQAEAYVKFLRGSNGDRTIVLWIPYGVSSTNKYIFKRTIFNNAWNGPWVKYNYQ